MNPPAKRGSKQNSPSPPLREAPPRHEVRGASVHEPIEQSWLQTDAALAPVPQVMQTWLDAQGWPHAGENVVQRPAWQVTACADASTKDPSSAVIPGTLKLCIVAWQDFSSPAKCVISDDRMPSNLT
jgi:hypothetical protein